MINKLTALSIALPLSFPLFASELIADGKVHRLDFNSDIRYSDFTIPQNLGYYKYLHIEAKGGDGGYAHFSNDLGSSELGKGGIGATLKAEFILGLESSHLEPSSTIRIIPGQRGKTYGNDLSVSADGGGGSGVFYKSPQGDWNTLLIAGAGGGGATSMTGSQNGTSGDPNSENGKRGGESVGTSGQGGSNGNGGNADIGGGGGGLKTAGSSGGRAGWNNYDNENSEPTGGSSFASKGFGVGAGGEGSGAGGGGGGGYSGGGGGQIYKSGVGGGSWPGLDSNPAKIAYSTNMITRLEGDIDGNKSTKSPSNGYISYQFVAADTTIANLDYVYQGYDFINEVATTVNKSNKTFNLRILVGEDGNLAQGNDGSYTIAITGPKMTYAYYESGLCGSASYTLDYKAISGVTLTGSENLADKYDFSEAIISYEYNNIASGDPELYSYPVESASFSESTEGKIKFSASYVGKGPYDLPVDVQLILAEDSDDMSYVCS